MEHSYLALVCDSKQIKKSYLIKNTLRYFLKKLNIHAASLLKLILIDRLRKMFIHRKILIYCLFIFILFSDIDIIINK